MLLFALLWLYQLSYSVSEGRDIEGLTNIAIKWFGPSYQPSGWSDNSLPVGLRRHDFNYDGGADENMSERGCFGYIIGGAVKGVIMGGLLGALAGMALRQNPAGIAVMASQGAQVLGPDSWPYYFEDCGGQYQSPINIQTNDLKKRKTKEPLKWINYFNVPRKMILQNSLHSIHANGLWKNSSYIPYITNGPLEKRYYFSQLHFHWGKTDDTGSEHTINRKSFPLEMHVVHDRLLEESTNLSEESNSDHLVVIAYMFEIVRNDNPVLTPILNGIKEVRGDEKKKAPIKPFPLNILVENFRADYVTYKGSLTTPPCTEGVIWIINSKPLGISDRQLAILRSSITKDNGNRIHNHRPVQKLNGRNVYYIHC